MVLEYYGNAIKDAITLHTLTNDPQYLRTAYYFSSKTKAIILQNELRNEAALHSIVSPELIEQEQELAQKVYDLRGQLSNEETDQDDLMQRYVRAQRELDVFMNTIEKEEPDYYNKKYAFITPPDIASIQALLPKDLAVVEYFYGKDTIYSFWITQSDFFHILTPANKYFEEKIINFTDQCQSPQRPFSGELGYSLYQKLLKEGLSLVGNEVLRLCIIPDGILHTIPFEALNSGDTESPKYLIEDFSISSSYSIGLLFRNDDRPKNKLYFGFSTGYSSKLNEKLKAKRLLSGEGNLAQFSIAQREISLAKDIFSGDQYLEDNASLENFYRYSSNASIIHLSLHGLVDLKNPLRSCIIFDDNEENFVLSAADLYTHKIDADLVVLSACHTASGKIFNGEGVQGMSKAFILSGAKSVLSCLWSASESSSLRIMTSFFQNIRNGEPNDLALHKAKLNYISTTEPSQLHPFYWANFILIGELDTSRNASFPYGKAAIVLSLLSLVGLFFYLYR